MTEAATETRSVVVEREFAYPPEKLWRALTQPHLIEEWLMKNDFAAGRRSSLQSSRRMGRRAGLRGPRRRAATATLAYTWNFTHEDAAFDLQSVVTFTLTPTGAGTHLRVEQAGFRPDQKQAYGGAHAGWKQFFAKLDRCWRGLTEVRRRPYRSSQEEVSLNWNMWIRQIHRWLSIAFTLAVIANIVALTHADAGRVDRAAGIRPADSAARTGLYMFALPYVSRRSGARA